MIQLIINGLILKPAGFFDWPTGFEQLDHNGRPLLKLNQRVNWQQFSQTLATVRDQEPKSNTGRKPFDIRLRFQIMILDSCYNLSDYQLEFQIQDRISFRPVLALNPDHTLPEAKTIWFFRPQLTLAGLSEKLFQPWDQSWLQNGFSTPKGQMVDASMVAVPRQPNSREENKSIKNGLNHFGDQNQIEIDVKHKLIGRHEVRPASVHDRHVWPEPRAENNSR